MEKHIIEALTNLDNTIKGIALSREYHDILKNNLNLLGETIDKLTKEVEELKKKPLETK